MADLSECLAGWPTDRQTSDSRTFAVRSFDWLSSSICQPQQQQRKARHRRCCPSPTSLSALSVPNSSNTSRSESAAAGLLSSRPSASQPSSSPPGTTSRASPLILTFTSRLGSRSSLPVHGSKFLILLAILFSLMCSRSILAAKDSSSTAQKASLITTPSLNSNNKVDVCHNFSVGDPHKGEFYSPRYPNDYPNNTECIAVLKAPFGSYIKVEFRDEFSLEESEKCEYDRLEIRNGQFGYSDLVDNICGHAFPQEITSTDNYLWLRFKSDESIEYSGFRAVYHFIPLPTTRPEPPACYFEKSGASGFISATEIHEEVFKYYHLFKTPIECIWNITVQAGWQMYVNFNDYSLARPNDCDVNYIEIYESILSLEQRKEQFCGTTAEPYKSDGSIVNIRYHVREGVLTPNKMEFRFEILFTAFRTNDREKCHPTTEFDCDDGTCIAESLKCDHNFNCKYRYDEDPNTTCFKGGKGALILTSEHMIVILVVFAALVVGMCTSIIVSCWGKIQERRQRELEYKLRRSRETSVEAGLDRQPMTVQSLDKNMMALVGNSMAASEFSSQHHPLLNLPPGRSHTPVLPAHHALPPLHQQLLPSLHHHRSHPKLANLASAGSSGDPVLQREEEEDEDGGDVDEEDEEMGNEGCYVCNESDLHHASASASASAQQHLHDRRVHQQQQQQNDEVDDEEDDQYSTDTPPQIISVNCPLYHQHQQQHQQQQQQQQHQQQHYLQQQQQLQQQPHHKSHVSIHSMSQQQNVYQRDRSDSDDVIPPPPPPPALSHLRGRVQVLR